MSYNLNSVIDCKSLTGRNIEISFTADTRTSITFENGRNDLWIGKITKEMFPKTHCLLIFYKTSKNSTKDIFEIVKRLELMPTETKLLSVVSDLPLVEEQFMKISVNTLIFQTKTGT